MKVAERVALLIIAISMALIAVGCFEDMVIDEIVTPDPEPTNPNRDDGPTALVLANAVNVNLLNITGCAPDPVIIEVKLGESIQIYNDDTTDHTLSWGSNSITIPAHETIAIVVSDVFPTGGGVLGYQCDDGPTAGIFVVEPTTLSPGGYEVVECDDFTDLFTQVEPIGCDGQRITGHRMLGDLDQWNQETVAIEFYTDQPTPKPLFGFMPKAVMNGNIDIVDMFCVHWRDEVDFNLKSALVGNRNGLLALGQSSHIDLEPDDRLVMVYRPYNTVRGQDGQHSVREMNLHLALVDYLNQEFKVNHFNLYGGSADGVVAIAVAQHRPELVATVGLSAPSLSVNTWDGYNVGGPTFPWVYDPWDYVENLPLDLPILTVYDLKDKVVANEVDNPLYRKTRQV